MQTVYLVCLCWTVICPVRSPVEFSAWSIMLVLKKFQILDHLEFGIWGAQCLPDCNIRQDTDVCYRMLKREEPVKRTRYAITMTVILITASM